MPVEDSAEKRLEESKKFVELLSARLPEFKSKIGLQVNYSCPNVGHNPSLLVNEVMSALPIFGKLGIPIMPKFNVLAPVGAVKEIAEDANCDAICIPNTIPFGKLPNKINWKNLFGADVSPLAHLGGGGFSGPQQFPLVLEWIKNAREIGIKKPINAGSVYEIDHIDMLRQVGASSISLGSVMTLRPWRVKQLIQRAHQLF
jgi:dihydroorotate dehydrogenase